MAIVCESMNANNPPPFTTSCSHSFFVGAGIVNDQTLMKDLPTCQHAASGKTTIGRNILSFVGVSGVVVNAVYRCGER